MREVPLILGLVVALLAGPEVSEAQEPPKIFRIGILSGESATTYALRIKAFREGLRQLGYVEGQSVAIEYRYADGDPEVLPALAADLVRLRVDVILTAGDLPTRAARQATQTIPIVVALIADLLLFHHRPPTPPFEEGCVAACAPRIRSW